MANDRTNPWRVACRSRGVRSVQANRAQSAHARVVRSIEQDKRKQGGRGTGGPRTHAASSGSGTDRGKRKGANRVNPTRRSGCGTASSRAGRSLIFLRGAGLPRRLRDYMATAPPVRLGGISICCQVGYMLLVSQMVAGSLLVGDSWHTARGHSQIACWKWGVFSGVFFGTADTPSA